MRTDVAHVRTSVPPRPLTRIAREDIADAVYRRSCQSYVYTCRVVDPVTWEPRPEYSHLDLIVTAHSLAEVRHAWERHALAHDADGTLFLTMTCTLPAIGKRRPQEDVKGAHIDLDMLLLGDELDELDVADRALGL